MRLHLHRVSTAVSALTATALLAGVAVVPARVTPFAPPQRHAAIPAEGYDMMPTGSAMAVERAKRLRANRP